MGRFFLSRKTCVFFLFFSPGGSEALERHQRSETQSERVDLQKNPSGFQFFVGKFFLLRKLESLHWKNGGSLDLLLFFDWRFWFVCAIMPQCLRPFFR